MSHQDFIQKPYLGLEVLSNNYEDIIEFVARINDIISTTKYVHLVTNASHDITQSFQTPVFYVSLMFAVTTPEFEPVDSEDTEIHIWKQTFEHMKYRWWKDVYHIIENCVK